MTTNVKLNKPRSARTLANILTTWVAVLIAAILIIYAGVSLYYTYVAYQQTLTAQQQQIAQNASKDVSNFIQEKINRLSTAVGLVNPVTADAETQKNLLESLLGEDPAFRQLVLLSQSDQELLHASRVSQVLSSQFAAQVKGNLVSQTSEGQNYIGPVYIDDATSEPLIAIAIPVKNAFGDFQGTLVCEINLKFMWDLVDNLKVGQTGYAYVVDNQGNLIAFHDTARVLANENVKRIGEVQEFVDNPASTADITPEVSSYTGLLGNAVVGNYYPLGTPPWAVVIELPATEANQPLVQFILVNGIGVLFFIVLGGLAGLILARSLAAPLVTLSESAIEISNGNLAVEAQLSGPAEVGQVATAFNTMTSRLRDMIGSLEQRVADRTKALSTVAEVSTAASTILNTDELLQSVVDLSKERFGFYHAHIYLLDETGDTLVLASGAGEVGRQMVAEGRSIPLDREQSLVARAARERTGVTVNDVTETPDFLPHPLLPNTHSEMAVPMIIGEQLIGVFDVQSEQIGRFTDADIAIQTTLASQVASSIQNSRSYTELQRNEALLANALTISRLGNWEYDLEKDLFTFNDQFYSIFRTTAEKVGGYRISSADYARHFVYPDDAPLVGAEIQRAIESKERFFQAAVEHRIIFPDGEIGYIAVKINLERDENGKITRWYGVNQDITERKRVEQQAIQRARQQEALNMITQKIQSTTSIEAALQIAARELGHALGKKSTLVAIEPSALSAEHKSSNKNEEL